MLRDICLDYLSITYDTYYLIKIIYLLKFCGNVPAGVSIRETQTGTQPKMKESSSNQYQIGFVHGFSTAVAISMQLKDWEDARKETTRREKKAARDWAISEGYLAAKLEKPRNLLSKHGKTFQKQKNDARDWAILKGYLS
jgi:hypothetical protein